MTLRWSKQAELLIFASTDHVGDTYGRDCDCACPQTLPVLPVADRDQAAFVMTHPHLRQVTLDEPFSVAYVPSLSRVAVVNQPVRDLLERLRQPQTLGVLSADEVAAAQRLWALGLLCTPEATDPLPATADELIVWLHVTNACNLRCTYCYIEKTDEAMSTATALTAVETIFRVAARHGYRRVLLKYAGGEASLNLPLVVAIQKAATERAIEAGITLRGVVLSNGVGLTHARLTLIKELGLRLMLSLDGLSAYHDRQRPTSNGQGSAKATMASIERVRKLGLDLVISVTVTGANAVGLPEVVAWLLERQLRFALNFYREHDTSMALVELRLDEQRIIEGMRAAYRVIEQQLPAYSLLGWLLDRSNLDLAHRRTCAVGENYLVIDHHGKIAKCQMTIHHPVSSIWADDPLEALRLDATGVQNQPVEAKEGCRSCEWRYWCTGGCALATFRATGRYDGPSPNCAIYKTLYPELIRLEALRLLQEGTHAAKESDSSHSKARTQALEVGRSSGQTRA